MCDLVIIDSIEIVTIIFEEKKRNTKQHQTNKLNRYIHK